jgi:hypothetical protein
MIEQRFPPGWDEQRVQRLLAELDNRTEEEWVAADEAAAADGDDQAVVTVPVGLLPEIRRLLARYKPKPA